jgi:hypothetical protein
MIPILWAVLSGATPAAPGAEVDSCEVSQITLDELWGRPECRVAKAPKDPNLSKAIDVEVKAAGPLSSGKPASVTVTLRNRSNDRVALLFREDCDENPPQVAPEETHFRLEIVGPRGKAPVERKYGMIGILMDRPPCPTPYVRVALRPGGTLETTVPFVAAARPPMEGWKGGARPVKTYDGLPSLPKGPLKAGAYSLGVTVSLANGVKLMGAGDVRVK